MIYLDTHIAIWICGGEVSFLTERAKELIQGHDLLISPIVQLELEYLWELNKIGSPSNVVIKNLQDKVGLKVCNKDFQRVVGEAVKISWTRDPFDRIITAHAALDKSPLLTKDEGILKHYKHAVWK